MHNVAFAQGEVMSAEFDNAGVAFAEATLVEFVGFKFQESSTVMFDVCLGPWKVNDIEFIGIDMIRCARGRKPELKQCRIQQSQ
ncbi:MAG: hypothetical protein KIT77_22670 [Caldilinea sp.]|nr:hypothetical protein [Caldilineaceae bacterium]MCB9117572.1 hypothetical protein [Caldilineaceae bacterium]MCW5844071.1 hypothetical protein [Caldilinea sp.]